MITVRTFRPSDSHHVVEVINAAAAADHTRRTQAAAFQNLLTGNHLRAMVATGDDRQVVGFLWAEPAHQGSQAFDGWVHPAWRRRGVGTALLVALESSAREQRFPITLKGKAYNDIPGTDALFRLRNYQEVRRFYMMSVSLTEHQFEVVSPPGIVLRSFQSHNIEALVEANNAFFAEHWGTHAQSVTHWKRNMIETRPHDPSLWILAWEGDQIVGECLCHLSREGGPTDGWVSTVGVHKQWRGRGLGQAVLAHGLCTLQQAGFLTAALHVDAENTPAVRLYERLHMAVVRTQVHFAKTISA